MSQQFVSYKKVPNWSDKIFENFVKYWKYFTIHRSKNFLHWRIFNNPFVKNYFVGLHLNKKPLGYFIYKIINKKIEIIDILIIPYNKKYNTIYLIDQILVYIDKISFKNKIEDCNFDFYLKNKLNKIIKDRLIKFGYFKKKELSDFSIKLFSSKLNKDFDKKFYITNINKAGRKY